MSAKKSYDVIIIGGSYAGLSAAMSLGRSLRKVLVIDSGLPCNRQTPHSHNFITHDGSKPAEIAAAARRQVALYNTVEFHDGLAEAGKKTASGFTITTASGTAFQGTKLIFASGIKDLMPDIPGFAECWGISVVHCPYCHGYEFRERKTGIFANGDVAIHLAQLVGNLTEELTIFSNGDSQFTEEQRSKLEAHRIAVVDAEVTHLEHREGILQQVHLKGGARISLDALYARLPFVQHCDIPSQLGCELNEQGFIKVDNMQKTTVAGVFAAGDNTSPMRAVAAAVAAGNFAGAALNRELVEESF